MWRQLIATAKSPSLYVWTNQRRSYAVAMIKLVTAGYRRRYVWIRQRRIVTVAKLIEVFTGPGVIERRAVWFFASVLDVNVSVLSFYFAEIDIELHQEKIGKKGVEKSRCMNMSCKGESWLICKGESSIAHLLHTRKVGGGVAWRLS
ncbi:hypothetical protein RJT34_16260 [Clitoria ternatea]|uniref:Uncharacterized protein n=1 Tax=Clitoria ternatea TaxID=43366 RepID=A0AAN9J6V8_CLITE